MKQDYVCPQCRKLTEKDCCPRCGCKTALAGESDVCFFVELSGRYAQMLSEVFQNNGLDFLSVPVYGGYSQTNTPTFHRFFVRYGQLQTAVELYGILWGQNVTTPVNVIGSVVQVVVDRPLGSVHPDFPDVVYGVNYGFVEGVFGGDGEAQDAYVLGIDYPVESFEGEVVAVIVRHDDNEDKWVVAPKGSAFSRQEIADAVNFQEKFFNVEIVTKN